MHLRRLFYGVLVAGALVAPAMAQSPALVGLDRVMVEPLAQTVPVLGRFVARQAGSVAAQTAGAVAEIQVQVGDRVAAGDVIALLDVDRLGWQRDLARASLEAARSRLAAAEARHTKKAQELARIEGIRDSAAFSLARYQDVQQEVIEAESAVAEARAARAQAEAELRLRKDDLRHGRITAPYDGVVTQRHTEVGSYLRVGDPVISMVNTATLEIEADVPFERVLGLTPGAEVPLRLPDGTDHVAAVRAVGGEENPMTRTRLVRFTPKIEEMRLPPAAGASATVMVPAGMPREVVTVPKDAVMQRQGMSLVYIVIDEVAQIRPIEIGEAVGDRFEVISGLTAGDAVVVRGNERLQPGQAVTEG